MTAPPPDRQRVAEFLGSARFVSALTTVMVGTAACSFLLHETIGWAGFIAILAGLVVLAAGSLVARRNAIEWYGLLPISLLTFLGWALISLAWSHYKWATVGGLAYLACFTALGIYIALVRDTIQIIRVFGTVSRFVLALSLAIEILAGVLIDAPIPFLDVLGKFDELGPIQGITGVRNQLAIVTVIALVTFAIEFRTRSVPRGLATGSVALGVIVLALTRSPVGTGSALVVGAAAVALYGLRRAVQRRRRFWQIGLLAATILSTVAAWVARGPIVTALNGGGDLSYRLGVWHRAWDLLALNQLQGWGWIGAWRPEIVPFPLFDDPSERTATSGYNAFLDVWFQLGLIGFVIFVGLVGLTFVRSWLLASRQRSVVYAWPALILVALITSALAESYLLIEYGWLTFVVCALKAAQQLSWRQALPPLPRRSTPEGNELGR